MTQGHTEEDVGDTRKFNRRQICVPFLIMSERRILHDIPQLYGVYVAGFMYELYQLKLLQSVHECGVAKLQGP